MDDFIQTRAIIKHFFKIRDELIRKQDVDTLSLKLEQVLKLVECSDSYDYFTNKEMSRFWNSTKDEIKSTIEKISGYSIDKEFGLVIIETKEGEVLHQELITPKEFVDFYLDIDEDFADFAELYLHNLEENIMIQLYHIGCIYELNTWYSIYFIKI